MDTTYTNTPRAFEPGHTDAPVPARTPGWDLGPERRLDDGRTLARGLGWFSIGLGLAELLAPERITRFLGVDDEHTGLVRFYGARELASGVAILSQRHPTAGVYSRIAGDTVDLASLAAAMNGEDANRGNIATAMAMVAGVTALDMLCAQQLSGRGGRE